MEYTVSAEEIKRVKGLGFLQDKRYPDVFNARVITVNGKITAAQHRAIAEACEKYGSGEAAMTVRLTIEIQGVKYENIEPLRAFLAEHGLTTGGTGKKSASRRFLQGNDLSVRADRHVFPFGKDT